VARRTKADGYFRIAHRLAHEAGFQIREPNIIRPWICADRDHTNALSSQHEDLAEVIGVRRAAGLPSENKVTLGLNYANIGTAIYLAFWRMVNCC